MKLSTLAEIFWTKYYDGRLPVFPAWSLTRQCPPAKLVEVNNVGRLNRPIRQPLYYRDYLRQSVEANADQ